MSEEQEPEQEPEQWLPVPGYAGRYEVSDHGKVRSLRASSGQGSKRRVIPKPLALHMIHGYLGVSLSLDGTRTSHRVHRLVLRAFRGEPDVEDQCGHIDGNSLNNHISNLRWMSILENNQMKDVHGTSPKGTRNGRSRLTEADVRVVLKCAARGETNAVIASRFGTHQNTISRIRRGETWTHVQASSCGGNHV